MDKCSVKQNQVWGFFQLLHLLPLLARRSDDASSNITSVKRIEHSGDTTRALLFTLIMLVVIQMDCVKSDTEVECPTSPSPPDCNPDCNGNKWFYHKDGENCQPCPKCDPGQGLDGHCDGKDGQNAKCQPCNPGQFSGPKDYSCQPCRLCDNTVGDTPCQVTTDVICGKCRPGYYHHEGTPDQCHTCEFLSPTELEREPQCQILMTDPPQEGSEESTSTEAMLAPTLSKEITSPPQETNFVSPSPVSGDLTDQVVTSTGIFSPQEEVGDDSDGSGDLAEEEQEADAPVPQSSNHVLNGIILVICAIILVVGIATLMYQCLNNRISQEANGQHFPPSDYVAVDVGDSEASVAVDVNAQTVSYKVNPLAKVRELSDNGGISRRVGSAESGGACKSSTKLLGSSPYSDSDLRSYITSNAAMPDDDERDVMSDTPINSMAHLSTSSSGPTLDYDQQAVKATSCKVRSTRSPDSQLSGEPLVFPAMLESSLGNASNIGTQHPTPEGSCQSVVTSAYPDGKEGVAIPEVTLCKENGIDADKVSTCQAACSATLGVTDVTVGAASTVVDLAAVSCHSPSSADTHADAALAVTDDASTAAAVATAAGAVDVAAISLDETDRAKLNNKGAGARSSHSMKSKKSWKPKIRVAPSAQNSTNGSEECSAPSRHGHSIYVIGSSKVNINIAGNYSNQNVGFLSTDTEDDE
ncbi:uncharacterized protein [Asterias amurensis]|uniref:uncharacterized protein n=1 Tax=Asterias amurensis TaxID=7602 RepID=UPI003AB42B87